MIEQMTATDAWALLQDNPDAVLVDVRTKVEWSFVGVPDLSSISKETLLHQWNIWQEGHNESFVDDISAAVENKDAPVLLLCRSGARSQAAAEALTAAGYTRPINVTAGFEGDLDDAKHRSGGWKTAGLPWVQS